MDFVNTKVEDFLDIYLNPPLTPPSNQGGEQKEIGKADLLVIDPPRA
jgi:hypothetical protein